MRRLIRLLHYLRGYLPQLLLSVPLAAGVGAADAFRLLLIGPILDRVLRPDAGSHAIALARLPRHPLHPVPAAVRPGALQERLDGTITPASSDKRGHRPYHTA